MRVLGVIVATWLVAACGAAAPSPFDEDKGSPSLAVSSAPTSTVTVPVTEPAVPSPTRGNASAPASPAAKSPVVLASKQYPYELTVPSGPVAFVSARGHWDGEQKLSSDSSTADHARAPGTSLMFIAMTETTKDVDGFADEMEARFQAWHGCAQTSPHRRFSAGDLEGILFAQSCAGGAANWVRAVVVGDGKALVLYTDGGTQDDIIKVLSGIRFVEP